MKKHSTDTMLQEPGATRLRLLECWLPLAQELRASEGWNDDAATLETLLLVAAAALQGAHNGVEARAILLTYHGLLGSSQP